MRFSILLIFVAITFSLYSCNSDSCANLNCFNGGICVDGSCMCPEGFTGQYCQTEIDQRAIFLGVYDCTEDCGNGPQQVSIVITPGSTPVSVTIDHSWLPPFVGIVNENALTIPMQSLGTTSTISGWGNISGNTLTLSYSWGTTSNQACSLSGTKL